MYCSQQGTRAKGMLPVSLPPTPILKFWFLAFHNRIQNFSGWGKSKFEYRLGASIYLSKRNTTCAICLFLVWEGNWNAKFVKVNTWSPQHNFHLVQYCLWGGSCCLILFSYGNAVLLNNANSPGPPTKALWKIGKFYKVMFLSEHFLMMRS